MDIGVVFTVLCTSRAWINLWYVMWEEHLREELPNHLTMTLEIIIFPNYAFFLMLWEIIVLTIQRNDTVKV